MAKRMLRLLLVGLALTGILPLTGCPSEDWGDLAKGWVEGNFHQMSHEYAAAQLDHIWLSGLYGSAQDGDVRVKQWVMQLPVNPDPAPIDVTTATYQQRVQAYVAEDEAIADLDTQYENLGFLLRSIDLTNAVCRDRHLFDARGLGWIGVYGPVAMIEPRLQPHADTFEFYVSTSFSFSAGGDGVAYSSADNMKSYGEALKQIWKGITDYNEVNEQNDKLAEALDELPSLAASPDEVFGMSRTSCDKAFSSTATMRQDAVGEANDLANIIKARRALLVARRDLVGSYLRPEEIQALATSDAGHAIISRTQETFLRGDITTEIIQKMLAAQQVGMRAVAASRCSDRLRFFERYHDMLVELDAQLTILQQLEGSSAATAAAQALTTIHTFEPDYPNALKRIASSGCHS